MDLEVGRTYRLVTKSDRPGSPTLATETFDSVKYEGEIAFWFPNARALSITVGVPTFSDAEAPGGQRMIPVRESDIISADLVE